MHHKKISISLFCFVYYLKDLLDVDFVIIFDNDFEGLNDGSCTELGLLIP